MKEYYYEKKFYLQIDFDIMQSCKKMKILSILLYYRNNIQRILLFTL